MDEAGLDSLPDSVARAVLRRVVVDLKEARDRLNQSPENSSRPPGSRAPWESRRGSAGDEEERAEPVHGECAVGLPAAVSEPDAAVPSATQASSAPVKRSSRRHPGKQPGIRGHGRTQKLIVHAPIHRYPEGCAACGGRRLTEGPAYTGRDTIDVVPLAAGEAGLTLGVTRTVLHETAYICGHHALPEAGRAVAPLEEQLVNEIEKVVLVHADETSWREAGQAL